MINAKHPEVRQGSRLGRLGGIGRVVLMLSLTAWAAFLLGLSVDSLARATASSRYSKLRVFTQVLAHIERSYFKPVDGRDLIYGAVRGMLRTLDPHSIFMTPDVYQEMKRDATGEFGGVGLEISLSRGEVIVISPVDGTPAQRAGIRAGDRILSIDGRSTKGMSLVDAAMLLRGEPGSALRLQIGRSQEERTLAFELLRERIRLVPVQGRLLGPGQIYVKIKSFQKNTFRLMVETLERLEAEAGGRDAVEGCILDLRNNPGGLLEQAVKVADEFLDHGLIVSTEGRDRRDQEKHHARRDGRLELPLVVLINHGSASASEIVAGALQDHGRAIILGTSSFGKGSVQTIIDLDDGSGLKLTVARYFTPAHRSIHEHGIDPDIEVQDIELPGKGSQDLPEELHRDHQLKTAVDHLRALAIIRGSR